MLLFVTRIGGFLPAYWQNLFGSLQKIFAKRKPLIALSVGLLGIIWGICGLAIWVDGETTKKAWISTGDASALIAREFTSLSMEGAGLVLEAMHDWAEQENIQTSKEFADIFGQRRYFERLRERIASSAQVDVATFINTEGRVVNFSRSFPPPPISLADRDYFISQMAADGPEFSIGKPVRNRGTGRWTFYKAKRVVNRESQTIGVVIVGIEVAYFADFFSRIIPTSPNSISLWRHDGELLSSGNLNDEITRTETNSQPPKLSDCNLQDAKSNAHKSGIIKKPSSQSSLLIVQPISNYPIDVCVEIGPDVIFGEWRSDRWASILIATVLSIMVVLSMRQTAKSHDEKRRREIVEMQSKLLRAVIEIPGTVGAVLDGNANVLLSSHSFNDLFKPSTKSKLSSVAESGGAIPIVQFIRSERQIDYLTEVSVADHFGRKRTLILSMVKQELLGVDGCTIIVGADITRRREAQMAIRQGAKLIMLGEMATGMAHELNQPINIIHMAAQNALGELEPEEPGVTELSLITDKVETVVSKLEVILSQTSRASDLISHMRIFGRLPSEPVAFDAREACMRALQLTGEQARLRDITIGINAGEQPALVFGQPIMLEQVLINLVNNACDAFEAMNEDKKQIDVICRADDLTVVIEVIDNGPGIPKNLHDRIFEPFFTTKGVGEGTGMGLAICYGVISEMNGSIVVAPSERGARIRIELPTTDGLQGDSRQRQN